MRKYSKSFLSQDITLFSTIGAFVCLLTIPAVAATRTWDAGGAPNLYWQTNANWSADTAPAVGDDLVFATGPAAASRVTTNDFAPNTAFHDIRITAASYVLWGNAINVTGNVTNTGGNPTAINLGLNLQQDTVFSSSTSTRIDMNGDISGSYGINKTDAGTLRLQSSTKTYSGGTTISGGTLDLNVANALPSGAGKGNVSVGAGTTLGLRFGQNINGLNGSGTIQALSSGTKVLTLGNGDANGTFTGTMVNGSGAVALTKVGNGTQTLNGTIGYSGATTVTGGALYLNSVLVSSTAVSVGVAGTLGGTGAVFNPLITTTVAGIIDPGGAAGLIGMFGFSGGLSLNSGSTALFQLDRSVGSDLLDVGGTFTLGDTWNLSNIGAAFQAGDTFDLFNAGTVAGTIGTLNLPSLDSGLGWDTSLLTTSGVISVYTVPEPSAAAMGLMGVAGLAFMSLFRRK